MSDKIVIYIKILRTSSFFFYLKCSLVDQYTSISISTPFGGKVFNINCLSYNGRIHVPDLTLVFTADLHSYQINITN